MLLSWETKGELLRMTCSHCSFSSSSVKNMSDFEWDQIVEVHLKGAFSCTKAAWPPRQKFGRAINISSAAGLYGM
jgi:NAD(P)-dependent dehydrogenase (short-subunit alcohol dehydrogenase family)